MSKIKGENVLPWENIIYIEDIAETICIKLAYICLRVVTLSCIAWQEYVRQTGVHFRNETWKRVKMEKNWGKMGKGHSDLRVLFGYCVHHLAKRLPIISENFSSDTEHRAVSLREMSSLYLCVTAVKCATDSMLKKTRLTPVTDDSSLPALNTMTSTCDSHGQDERFEDGLTTENIKCTDVLSTGKLSRQEHSCAGSIHQSMKQNRKKL